MTFRKIFVVLYLCGNFVYMSWFSSELEYAKQLIKLSQTTRSMLSDQSFLPFQSLYCTALDHVSII